MKLTTYQMFSVQGILQGFSAQTLLTFWAGYFCAVGYCARHRRRFNSIPHFCPLDTNSAPPHTLVSWDKYVSRYCKNALEVKSHPLVYNIVDKNNYIIRQRFWMVQTTPLRLVKGVGGGFQGERLGRLQEEVRFKWLLKLVYDFG